MKEEPSDEAKSKKKKTGSMTWAQRLKRVFGIDIETCFLCGAKVKVLSTIEDPKVIKRILTYMGLESEGPKP